jgi:hypothetical protein
MTKTKLALLYKDLIENNPDIINLFEQELGDSPTFYVNVDINTLDDADILFPYVHINGISKNTNADMHRYLIVLSISALNNSNIATQNQIVNETASNIETVINKIVEYLITQTLRGLGGERQLEIENINEVLVYQDGQNDTQQILEIEISQKRCKFGG